MKTVRKDFQFKGMRKPQSFIFYPCTITDETIFIQSKQRLARINIKEKKMFLSKGRSSGSYSPDLCENRGAKYMDLTPEEMEIIIQGRNEMAGYSNKDGSINLLG